MVTFDEIQKQINLEKIISEFYDKVFSDIFIGYFFTGKDKQDLIEKQISFSTNLLGGKAPYKGMPLKTAHNKHFIRRAHFNRRQLLLRETLEENQISSELIEYWLKKEQSLAGLVLKN